MALCSVVALLPVWGILVPGTVIWMLWRLLYDQTWILYFASHLYTVLGFILGLLFLFTLGVQAVLNLSDNRIVISKLGMEFPFFLGNNFGLRRNFAWAAIRSAVLLEDKQKRELVLHTTDGLPIRLDCKCIPTEELEQLLVGLDVWATNCEKSPELEKLQDELQKSCDHKLLPSYTAMWEDELARRFTATAYMPLEPGHSLQSGKLKVVSQLSFGGLSAVYLCQQNERDLVVLKEAVVPQDSDEDVKQKSMEFFERESRILMKLNHPAIVKVLDCFVDAGRHYMLIEYHSGQDLGQYIKQNGVQSEARVLKWAIEIAGILEYLHTQDPPIIHRDVTPDNLVLEADNSITMIDFGAANEFLGKATGTLVGKQSFIAPEQFRGKASVQSDLYALGCTLHFLLTGKEPIPLSVSRPRSINCEVSEEMDNFVASLTAMDEAKRIASAQMTQTYAQQILDQRAALAAAS